MRATVLSTALILMLTAPASAQAPLADVLPLPEPIRDNLRLSVDLASRVTRTPEDDVHRTDFAGLDLHKVVSTRTRDLATLTVQLYLTKLNDAPSFGGVFEHESDTALIYRIVTVDVPLRRDRSLQLRAGHFEVPFGLEHVINTNGTLRDYQHGANLGVKADWGAALHGRLLSAEYEVALTRGGGQRWESDGDPWIAAGRIGTSDPESGIGLSGYVGHPATDPVGTRRWRAAVDLRRPIGPLTALAELGGGADDGRAVSRSILELDWEPTARWLIFVQSRSAFLEAEADWNRSVDAVAGARLTLGRHAAISLQSQHRIVREAGDPGGFALTAQARYRI